MDAAPLTRVSLAAASIADDLGFAALTDLAGLLGGSEHRIIGGHMVSVLAARWNLGAALMRETADTDLGAPPIVVRDHRLIERLITLGYVPIAGNRYARPISATPVIVDGREVPRHAIIDVLVPAYTSRPRDNQRISELLVTTEVPGLAFALARPALRLTLALRRLDRASEDIELSFPDEVAALALKLRATQVRNKATDIVDVWRCLEIGFAAEVSRASFGRAGCDDEVAIARALFDHRDGPSMRALCDEQRLSSRAGDERFTRIRALIERVLGERPR